MCFVIYPNALVLPIIRIECVKIMGRHIFISILCQKTDIFKGIMWYAYEGEWMNWFTLTTEQANAIIDSNKSGQKVSSLEEYAVELSATTDAKVDFENVVGQDSLTRFDRPKGNPNNRKRKRSNKRKPRNERAQKNNSTKSKKNAN